MRAARALPLGLSARGPVLRRRLPRRRQARRSTSLAAEVEGIVALVGFPERAERPEDERAGTRSSTRSRLPAHNSLAVLADGEVRAIYRKIHLPNYGVFDERRYFEPGHRAGA